MSSYRERLWGNWFSHYQRAESARVRDKRVKKCLHLLSIYPHPSLYPFIFLSVFFWSVSPFQTLNHQTTILLSAPLVTEAIPIIIPVYYLMCAICANIHLHTVVLLPVSEEDHRAKWSYHHLQLLRACSDCK